MQDIGSLSKTDNSRVSPLFIATLMTRWGETGVQTHFNAFVEFLESEGEHVEVLTPYEAPFLIKKAINALVRVVRRLNIESGIRLSRYLQSRLLRYRLRSRLPQDSPWLVYAQCPDSALAALDVRRIPGQRVALAVHFNISHADEMADRGRIHRNGNFYRAVKRQETDALTESDAVVFCSEFMHRELLASTPALRKKLTIVSPNFVQAPVCAAEGLRGDIITIGTLEPRKNQTFLLRVLAETKKRGKDYRLTIVGKGEDESKLKRLGGELGISNQVTFAGFVPHAARFLGRHRIYAHSAIIENLPITLIEAMAAGLPVLAPSVGGIPEIVEDAVEGFLWPLQDPVMASQMLIEVLENEQLCHKFAAAARRKFESRFTTEMVAPKLRNFLLSDGTMDSQRRKRF